MDGEGKMKRLAFVIIGFAVGLGPLWLTLSQEEKNSNKEEQKEPDRSISSTPQAPSTSQKTKEDLKREIQSTNDCYETQNCQFPQTDARSYDFAVGKKLAAQLKEFRESYPNSPELAGLAETYVKSYDGHVQEEALKIMSALPASPNHLEAIFTGLQNTPDPLIVEQAMQELQRYMGTADEARVQEFLTNLMAHGAQYSSEKASELILAFLHERNIGFFRDALKQMTPGSIASEHLRSALKEFERMSAGG